MPDAPTLSNAAPNVADPISTARACADRGDWDGALSALSALDPATLPPLERARMVALRCWLDDQTTLVDQLPDAARALTAAGRWGEAWEAWSLLARLAVRRGDLAEVRLACAVALGAGELAGGPTTTPSVLQLLARAELQAGEPARARAALERALAGLEPGQTYRRRSHEAECLDLLGDAALALAEPAEAERCWARAELLLQVLHRDRAAARVGEKRRTLRG
jgi:hypothetical protein